MSLAALLVQWHDNRNQTRKARREYWNLHRNKLLSGNQGNDPEEAELDEEWEDEEV